MAHHIERALRQRGIDGGATVGDEQAFVTAVVGGAQRRVHGTFEPPAAEQEIGSAAAAEDPIQGTVVETVDGRGGDDLVTLDREHRCPDGAAGLRRGNDADHDPARRPDRRGQRRDPSVALTACGLAGPPPFVEPDEERQPVREDLSVIRPRVGRGRMHCGEGSVHAVSSSAVSRRRP